MPPPKVLIADDDPDILVMLKLALQEHFTLLVARDGVEAWKLVQAERPRVVLTDLNMPGINGQKLAAFIREDPDLTETRIIILTGTTANDDLPAGFWRIGTRADVYLEKPVSPEDLLREVRRQLLISAQPAPLPPGMGYYEGFGPVPQEPAE